MFFRRSDIRVKISMRRISCEIQVRNYSLFDGNWKEQYFGFDTCEEYGISRICFSSCQLDGNKNGYARLERCLLFLIGVDVHEVIKQSFLS